MDDAGDTGLRVDLARSLVRFADTSVPIQAAVLYHLNLARFEADTASVADDACLRTLSLTVNLRLLACATELGLSAGARFGVVTPGGELAFRGGRETADALDLLGRMHKAVTFLAKMTAETPELHRAGMARIAALIGENTEVIALALGPVEKSASRGLLH